MKRLYRSGLWGLASPPTIGAPRWYVRSCAAQKLGPTPVSFQQSAAGSPGPRLLDEMLARHGLINGKTVRLDMRLAEGRPERLSGLAEALVHDGATVILAFGQVAGRAAQAATKTIPIVCVGDDLV